MKILCAVDFTESTQRLITAAEKIAAACHGSVILLHVLPPDNPEIDFHPTIEAHFKPPEKYYHEPGSAEKGDSVPILHHKTFRLLQTIADWLKDRNIASELSIIHGDPVSGILEKAAQHNADMIMLASHGHKALRKLIMGSVCQGILQKSPIPVTIVPKEKEAAADKLK